MAKTASAPWIAWLGFVVSVVTLGILCVTVAFSYLSIAFGISGSGGIIPISWIVAVGANALPFLLAIVGLCFGIVGRDRGLGVAAIVIGAAGALGSAVVIAICMLIGLTNLPS